MKYTNSPTDSIIVNDVKVFVKRDDLLDKDFSGNKARKFYYFLNEDFSGIEKIISYGSAQANSLYSLSVLAKIKEVKLDFYVKHIASFLKENPEGNYKAALANGANIIECDVCSMQEYIEKTILPKEKNSVFIEEGGRVKEASFGIEVLANEIIDWVITHKMKNPKIFLPSGTGTTALFLQKFLPYEVLTCACVGDEKYLKEQFFHLNSNENEHPTIVQRTKKFHFGKLYDEFYEIHKKLKKETKIEFDLLYDSLGWISLINSHYFKKENTLLYIHQGGILGNSTMIERYKRRYNLRK